MENKINERPGASLITWPRPKEETLNTKYILRLTGKASQVFLQLECIVRLGGKMTLGEMRLAQEGLHGNPG